MLFVNASLTSVGNLYTKHWEKNKTKSLRFVILPEPVNIKIYK